MAHFDPCNPCQPCPPRHCGPQLTITNGVPTGEPGPGDLPIAFDAAAGQLYGWTEVGGWTPIAPPLNEG